MPEGRAERAVEAPAKSIDRVEHSGMIKGVMAVGQIDTQDRPHVLCRDDARSCSRSPIRSATECTLISDADRRHTTV
jgi:hypothetical protein